MTEYFVNPGILSGFFSLVGVWWRGLNRFSGLRQGVETVETVLRLRTLQNTPLKQGVNDKKRSDNHFWCETFGLDAVVCEAFREENAVKADGTVEQRVSQKMRPMRCAHSRGRARGFLFAVSDP
jgi:hypothetical protein